MPFQKGQSGNPNGRPKGVSNKLAKQAREKLWSVLGDEVEKIPEYLEQLEVIDKLDFIAKMLPYMLPKLASIELSTDDEGKTFEAKDATPEQLKEYLSSVDKAEQNK